MEDGNNNYKKINFDMFGKKISLFFNGNETDGTTIGKVMTFTYVGLYIILFLIFTCMVILKKNGSYYDSEINPEELQEIKLNRDLLYFGFSLQNDKTYDSYLDETIYYPKAYYKQAKREESNVWKWELEEIEIEKCKIEKFGEKYQNLFSNKPLDNLYCIKNINQTLKGHYIYDEYSLYSISIFPCINTTENNNSCKSIEEIENKIDNSFFAVELESIGLSPKNHSYPAQPIAENLYTSIGTGYLREFHIFLELVEIQTDENPIYEDIKKEKFLKYYKNNAMISIKKNNVKNGESVCNFELKLSDKIKIQKRSYTKIYTALSNTGGVMIFIKGLIFLFTSLPVQILHELNVINKLFNIDKSKKELSLSNLKKFTVMPLRNSVASSNIGHNSDEIKEKKVLLSSRLRNSKNKKMLDIISKDSQQKTYNSKINNKICDSINKINIKPKKTKNSFSCFYRQSLLHEGDNNSTSNLVAKKKQGSHKYDNSRIKLIPENKNNINIISRINQINASEINSNKDNNHKQKKLKNEKFKTDRVVDFSLHKEQIDRINNLTVESSQRKKSCIKSPEMTKKNNSEKIIFNSKLRDSLMDLEKNNNGKQKKLRLSYLETYFVRICKGKMKNKKILLFEEITDCYRKYLDVIKIFRNQIVFDRLIENNMNIEQFQKLEVLKNNKIKIKPKITSPQKKKKIKQKTFNEK